jgi:SAM-dependent methyltransferase
VPLTCLVYAIDNLQASLRLSRVDRAPDDHLAGTHIERDIAYAETVAKRYLCAGPIHGKVAEVGSGGSAAVALLLLSSGANSVDLIDRFSFRHAHDALAALYSEIIKREPRLQAMGFSPSNVRSKVRSYTGESAAAEIFFANHGGYDAIVSNAVLEHLYDPLSALEAMIGALKPRGRLVHQVDVRDHGMFSAAGHHELTFLTIPEWIYGRMHRRRGRPNRVLINHYRDTLARLPVDYELVVTNLVGIGAIDAAPYSDVPGKLRAAAEAQVEKVRPKLAASCRSLAAADLAVSAFSIFATAHG